MNLIVSLMILALLGILCTVIHKNKGYSPIAGFLWGFFFNIIGLVVVMLERNKEDQLEADKNGLSMTQWLLIFLSVGIAFIIIFIAM